MIIEGEECKFIEGTDEFYAVSVTGKVWSFRSRRCGAKRNVRSEKPELMRTKINKDGYVRVRITHSDGIERKWYMHRLVAIAFIPNPDNLPQVNHKNEIKTDNRVENLEWMSCKDNINYGSGIERRSGKNHPGYIYICQLRLAYLRNVNKLSYTKIKNELGVSRNCVIRHLKDLGIK